MRLASGIRSGVFFLTILGFLVWQFGAARERGPRVEVRCPSAPVPVKLGEQQAFVYELHVTNFDSVPLTLNHLEVFADAEKTQPLVAISGDGLSKLIIEVGADMHAKSSQTIAPGKRSVLFMFVTQPLDRQTPNVLRHRITFAAGAHSGAATETVLDDFPVTVSKDLAPLLRSPFEGGSWFAGEGPSNDSDHRRTITAVDGQVNIAQRFAIDWVKVGPNGDSHHDGTTRNENWWGYGEPIHAVADGEVTKVVDGIPENTPRVLPKTVTLDNIAGNYVTVRIAANRYATYAHLQNGSIRVHLHDQVHGGDVLGRLGNSGNATAPHLHFQLTDGNSVLQSEGVPFIFNKFTYLGPGSEYEADKHLSIPRDHSIPGNNDVVEFAP